MVNLDPSLPYIIMPGKEWATLQSQFTAYQTTAVLLFFGIIGMLYLFHKAFPFLYTRFISHNITIGIMNPITHTIEATNKIEKKNGKYWYNGKRLDFVKVYPGAFFFAGNPFDLLDIDLKEIDSPEYAKACDLAKEKGYNNIDELERALLFSMMEKNDPRVIEIIEKGKYASYEDAKTKINPANIDMHSGIVKYFFNTVPMSEILGYGYVIPPEDITGEVDDTYEARKPSKAFESRMRKAIPICIILVGAAGALVIAYKLFFQA